MELVASGSDGPQSVFRLAAKATASRNLSKYNECLVELVVLGVVRRAELFPPASSPRSWALKHASNYCSEILRIALELEIVVGNESLTHMTKLNLLDRLVAEWHMLTLRLTPEEIFTLDWIARGMGCDQIALLLHRTVDETRAMCVHLLEELPRLLYLEASFEATTLYAALLVNEEVAGKLLLKVLGMVSSISAGPPIT